MMIEDEDLRSLYQDTSEARIQALEAGLLERKTPPNSDALETLRREAHSLKGDARVVGIEPVADLALQIEKTIQSLQRAGTDWPVSTPLSESLSQALQAIRQLVRAATIGTPVELNAQQVGDRLSQALEAVYGHTAHQTEGQTSRQTGSSTLDQTDNKQSIDHTVDQTIDQTTGQAFGQADVPNTETFSVGTASLGATLIEDEELREIYKTTSEARLQRLSSALTQLENDGLEEDGTAIAVLRKESHSFKGDAQSLQLSALDSLAGVFEDVVIGLERQQIKLTAELQQVLNQSLLAMGELVQQVTLGTTTQVNATELIQSLLSSAADAMPAPPAPMPIANSTAPTAPEKEQPAAASSTASAIEDEELREIYRATTVDRLQRLEVGFVALEQQPNDTALMAELMREAHSLKGDASSVGLERIEGLAHATEDVLIGVQSQAIALNPELGDLLYRSLDEMAQLVETAITGQPHPTHKGDELLRSLREIAPSVAANADTSTSDPDGSTLESTELALPTPVESDKRLDTIRVQTRALDTLVSQSEQLTLTRIQTAQIAGQIAELADLWEKWRTHQGKQPIQPPTATAPNAVTPNPHEKALDNLIGKLQFAAQDNSFKLESLSQDLSNQVQSLRRLPIASLLRTFPRVIRDLAKAQSKSVNLVTEGDETTADKSILEDIQDPLMHLVRNAIDHGIETTEARSAAGKPPTAQLRIRSSQTANSIVIEVTDDGQGLDLEAIKQTAIRRNLYDAESLAALSDAQVQDLIFMPGFSTRSVATEISGRGVGLDVVRTQIERLKGNVKIESTPGQGCTFRLQISTQLATANVVFVLIRGLTLAIPIEYLQTTLQATPDNRVTVEGEECLKWQDQTLPMVDLFDVLELAQSPAYEAPNEPPVPLPQRPCLLLKVGDDMGAFLVDQLLNTEEVVFKPQSALLKRVRNVSGATILGNGQVCSILNPPDLVKSVQRNTTLSVVDLPPEQPMETHQPRILLVEDSPPVRILEKRLLESAGYKVITAEDGLEGYKRVRNEPFDAVVSDIEMPTLDGLAMTSKIREHDEYEDLPIILVTTLSSDEDRKRGAEAGANAYIIKGRFNQEALLGMLNRLI